MTSIKPQTSLQSLLADPKINKKNNDVTWASGWTGQIHTAQFRLGSDEAKKLVGALGDLTRGQQRAILRELQKVTAEQGGVGSVSIISSQAAGVFESAAKSVGLNLDFEVNRKRAPAPMG